MAIKFVDKEPEEPKTAGRKAPSVKPERPVETAQPDPPDALPAGQRRLAKSEPKPSARKKAPK